MIFNKPESEKEKTMTKTGTGYMRLPCSCLLISGILLTGCLAGPDFSPPPAPKTKQYTQTPIPSETSASPGHLGNSQLLKTGTSINPGWWRAFRSPKLDRLIEKAVQTNPDLTAARATLRQAQELFEAGKGTTNYPQVSGNLSAQRQRLNPGIFGQAGDAREFSLYNAGIDVRYNLDLSGGSRRTLEALAAKVDYQHYQVAAARLNLAGAITANAITEARLSGQIRITEAILESRKEQLKLTEKRLELGHAARDETLAAKIQVHEIQAELSGLRKQYRQTRHLLAILAGQSPGAVKLPDFTLKDFSLPPTLPLSVPSELVRNRPDIRAAEALLHIATANYGIAIAKLYPQLTLSGELGSQALTTGLLFGSGSAVWSLIAQLTQPLFKPGLPAEKRAALAELDAASANYRSVVLESLRNVADVLVSLKNDSEKLTALSAAETAARERFTETKQRYSLGAADYLQVLTSEQEYLQTKLSRVESQAIRLADTNAFYLAMGGSSGESAQLPSN